MPGWPSAAERRELGAFPGQTGPEDVKGFFELAPDDLRFARTHRGEARLGVAVQLCSLRWLGFVPDDLTELPQPALLALCEQLEADPDDLALYGTRDQTRSDHFLAVRDRAGFKAFDSAERARLQEWLVLRAMEHERPKALHTLTCEQLRSGRVVRPAVDVLVRLIGAAREAAHAATSEALAPQLRRPKRAGELDGLLDLREPGGVTWLEWIRTPAPDSAPAAIVAQLAKYEHLGSLGADGVDLSMLAPGRVRILAADARRRSAWEISRLSATRRHPLLLVFVAEMLRERGDELIDRYCSAIQNAERTAGNAVKKQREETARARDQRSSLAGTLARILLDAIDHGEDPVSRTLREVGEQRLREAVADPGALAVPIEQERRDALHRRHQHLAQFAPAVIAALDLTASRGYERLLAAVEHTTANRHLRLLPDAPLQVLPAAWRAWTLDDQGRPVRTRYEVALWLLVRDALRARGLYRARSHRYGDPAGWMMPSVQWQRERTELAAVFGRPLDGATRLAELEASQHKLVRRLQDGFDARERVLFDGHRIVSEPPSEQRVEKPAVAGVVHGMLPLVEIASLVIETHHDIGFLDELQHRGGSVARSGARLGQLVAVLLADASGIGFARMAQASGFTEKEMRDAAARHYTPENLAAANTRVLERLRLLPHRWILDELLTSSDGQRWETIGKSPIAGYAARYVGYRKRMLTWLLWLTGQYGHFGGKVIPVTERESWHTLDALVGLDTSTIQHTSDTHGATELVFAIFDLLGWDFVPRMSDLADRRLYRLGDPQPEIAADKLLAHRGRPELIDEQYEELMRIAGSIKRGWIVPSLLISRMATDPRPDRTGKALREYGRIVETNFILRWAGDPVLRRRAHGALNRHENSNALHRAISYGNRGRVRARDPETVQRQFESRRLMANLVIYWNARYMALAFSHLDRLGVELLDPDVAQVHNAHHEHINMYGRHDIDLRTGPRKGKHRPLRQPAQLKLPAKSEATNATATNA